MPGARIGDISAAIGAVGRAAGYGICTDFGGHGVGRAMHEDPHVPNEGAPGRGRRLVPGLVIAIEPWFLAGGKDMYRIDRDGWTIRSGDGSRAAHAEHTVAVTAGRPAGPDPALTPLTSSAHGGLPPPYPLAHPSSPAGLYSPGRTNQPPAPATDPGHAAPTRRPWCVAPEIAARTS